MLDRKAKSFEEREQEYERVKRRIFKDVDGESMEQLWHNYSNSGENYQKFGGNGNGGGNKAQHNRLLKVQTSVCDFCPCLCEFHLNFENIFYFGNFHSQPMAAMMADRIKYRKVIVSVAMDHNLKVVWHAAIQSIQLKVQVRVFTISNMTAVNSSHIGVYRLRAAGKFVEKTNRKTKKFINFLVFFAVTKHNLNRFDRNQWHRHQVLVESIRLSRYQHRLHLALFGLSQTWRACQKEVF